jgi:hypothetical protein
VAAQAPRAAASGPVGGSITPAAGSVLAAFTTARPGGIHVYDALDITRVRVRAVGTVDLAPVHARRPAEGVCLAFGGWSGYSTTPPVTLVATNTADDVLGSAKPWDLQRTETLAGRASQTNVDDIAASMRQNGWVGEPIEVFQANGQNYIVNGHHRVAAACQAGIDVQYRVISDR